MSDRTFSDRVVSNAPTQSSAQEQLGVLELLASVHGAHPDAIAQRRAALKQQIADGKMPRRSGAPTAAAAPAEPAKTEPTYDEQLAELQRGIAQSEHDLGLFMAGVTAGRKER